MIASASKIWPGVILAAAAFVGTPATAMAADKAAASDEASAGVHSTIDKSNALMKRNGPLNEFIELFYEDDLMIIGEGEKALYRGMPSFAKRLAYYMEDQTHCSLKIIDPVRSSGNLAA